ncbi:uncharacterized protein LOC106154451 [Lingula anatina]|uniref:Uncharacterized protein LOC106154451 n=1 Tax=Lingula anatina TaxID=7574 RepID=A0A1S3HDW8_LINAN|nr:uncharacterized protein LOC106154451 [Lingula anatina]|eukprot:XP_013384252.1 uncharacterized protein LOC106154451 [Lingula anatina]
MELTYKYIVILLCVLDVTLGIQTYDIKRRDVQATSQSQCSVTSTLLDILKNELNDLKKDNKKSLRRLEDRYDDLVDKYSKLLQTTTNLQVKFANFTSEKPGGKLHF